MKYCKAVKMGILKKVMAPEKQSILKVARESGINPQTIRNWIKETQSGKIYEDADEKSIRSLSYQEKYHLLKEYFKITKEEKGKFLRERGLHSEHLTLWDQELREMVQKKSDRKDKEMKELKKKVKELEKELSRKDKALAETTALLVLKKKLDLLMGDPEED
jgi:transposase-like protein